MSPALNGSSAIQRFEGNDAIEIHDGITFDFYTGLPHMYLYIPRCITFSLDEQQSIMGHLLLI